MNRINSNNKQGPQKVYNNDFKELIINNIDVLKALKIVSGFEDNNNAVDTLKDVIKFLDGFEDTDVLKEILENSKPVEISDTFAIGKRIPITANYTYNGLPISHFRIWNTGPNDYNIVFCIGHADTGEEYHEYIEYTTVGNNEFEFVNHYTSVKDDSDIEYAPVHIRALFGDVTVGEIKFGQQIKQGLMTLEDKEKLDNAATKTEVNAKYTKPSAGIPKSDLTNTVQASLNKADSALQHHQDISHLATKEEVENNEKIIIDKLGEINNTKLDINLNTITKTGEDKIKELINADEMYNNASNAIIVANNQIKEVSKLKNDVETYIGAGKEQVVVSITSSVEGVSVSGLTLYVYLNNAENPIEANTDENGMATFRVDVGYKYRIVFPNIEDCEPIPDVTHTAGVAQRSVEVEYIDVKIAYEYLTVKLDHQTSSGTTENVSGKVVKLIVDGETEELTTNTEGTVTTRIIIGKEYRLELPKIDGFYIWENNYVYNLTAEINSRFIFGSYTDFESGIFIITNDLKKYTKDEWIKSSRPNSDAKLIYIATLNLLVNNAFAIAINDIYEATYNQNVLEWGAMNIPIKSYPFGLSTDGFEHTLLLTNEAEKNGFNVPAADYCKKSIYNINGLSLQGFLPSFWQVATVYSNKETLDDIISLIAPEKYNFTNYMNELLCTVDVPKTEDRVFCIKNGKMVGIDSYGGLSRLDKYKVIPYYKL